MTSYPPVDYRRNAVEPIECLKASWELIKDQYWLFVGICIIGMMVGSAVPLGILMGPMMCGMYLTFFRKRQGLPIEFGTLFKGFDYFGQSVVAAILHVVPIMAIVIFMYVFLYVGMIATMVTASAAGDNGGPVAGLGMMFVFIIFFTALMLIITLISIGFTFAYPLIVDRNLQGLEAVKVSFRAAFANFWRLLGLNLLSGLLGMVGMLLCYIGFILVIPITIGASALAYEQVFGIRGERAPDLPPPPPVF
ncbi:MAG TPA: hypothetical protein VI306_01410 [Pyrinomonadaceae bacterium]